MRNVRAQMSHPNGYNRHAENGENTDWMDEENLDLNGVPIPQDEKNCVLPIYSMKDYFALSWDNGKAQIF